MPSIVYDAAPSGRILFRNPLQYVCERTFKEGLEKSGPALTLLRLCTSRHANDLQWIAIIALAVFIADCIAFDAVLRADAKDVTGYLTIFTGIAAGVAVTLNWAYQTGSSRLGAIDLFASEIGVICRVCLIIDFAKQSLASAAAASRSGSHEPHPLDTLSKRRKFTSEEHYTPVYDENFADLKPLDVDVVSSVTQFYTYRKTMIDYLRLIAVAEDEKERYGLTVYMIYMQFLMYENARFATQALVEFEPVRSEVIINVLCSEISMFQFLREHFSDDFRAKRLSLRMHEYDAEIPALIDRVKGMTGPNWDKAAAILPELEQRFADLRTTERANAGGG